MYFFHQIQGFIRSLKWKRTCCTVQVKRCNSNMSCYKMSSTKWKQYKKRSKYHSNLQATDNKTQGTEDMNQASFLPRKVSQSRQLLRTILLDVCVHVFMYFRFSQDATLCFDSFYTAKSHKSSRRESSTSSSDSQCGHRGGTPDLGEIRKGFFSWPL